MAREIAFSNSTRVLIVSAWAVTTLPSGAEIQAHPQGSSEQAATADRPGYGGDVAAMTRDQDPLHAWLCDALGLPTSFALSEAAGQPINATIAALEERAVLAVQAFMRASGGRLPF